MDAVDASFLQRLFTENNELRSAQHALTRELFNKNLIIESLEEDLLNLRENQEKVATSAKDLSGTLKPVQDTLEAVFNGDNSRELQNALVALDHQRNELRSLKEELAHTKQALEEHQKINDQRENELHDLRAELLSCKRQFEEKETKFSLSTRTSAVPRATTPDLPSHYKKQLSQLKDQLQESDALIQKQQKQMLDISTEASLKYSEQQTQLQGLEALLESVMRQYEEFLQVTKLEHEQSRSTQQAEYVHLKEGFENYKKQQFEEKRNWMLEHQGMLFTMQALFDEYRKSSEFLFTLEISKLEDELVSQSLRYEHEIMYIVQAKDKFYAEMMVSKDAKIMNLIEGSDLTSLLQKHEADIEAVRRDYQIELERMKTQQDGEQKQIIQLLQRQNSVLETKAEKLSLHIKNLETRLKEYQTQLDFKKVQFLEKEEQVLNLEHEMQRLLQLEKEKYLQVIQEKEFLRHRVIRLTMESKGVGQTTLDAMVKKLSKETFDLQRQFLDTTHTQETLQTQKLQLEKKNKYLNHWNGFLESELKKRNDEFHHLVVTFESFLKQRSKHIRKERLKKWHQSLLHSPLTLDPTKNPSPSPFPSSPSLAIESRTHPKNALNRTVPNDGTAFVKVEPPESFPGSVSRGHRELDTSGTEKQEMERAFAYLKRFKTISHVFTREENFKQAHHQSWENALNGQPQKLPMEDPQDGLYSEGTHVSSIPLPLYQLYSEKGFNEVPPSQVYTSPTKPTSANTATKASKPLHGNDLSKVPIYDYENKPIPSTANPSHSSERDSTSPLAIGKFKGGKVLQLPLSSKKNKKKKTGCL
ncbi:hypothetical protein HMI54_015741 [Coelomomyces lativittatus]|nr:hypothetical protein HMI56_000678 [Coelomomyces lativittatus]KAJ1511193.1 hypothetical protein HMI55_006696 [Coelomomyces lativittatus]KAJ1512419.1 hypothetical protein HMI54_015741 [Coelomomyces lativittatus]